MAIATPGHRIFLHEAQSRVFADKHRFKVVVAGRRWGKCLASDTMISMADGSEKPIQDVKAGDWVLTVNEDTYEIESKQVQHVLDNGVKETMLVGTGARTLRCTPNHPILANNRWIEAGDLEIGDLVAVPRKPGPKSNRNYLPIAHDDLADHIVGSSSASKRLRNEWRKQTPTRISTRRYDKLSPYTDGYFDPIAYGDVAWEEVTKLEASEETQTWDLTVDGNHNFFAEGMVTHNTMLALVALVVLGARMKNTKIWYVAPSYTMAKNIMWEELKRTVPRAWIAKKHDSELKIQLKNGTWIELKGADNPDSLRGVGLAYVVLDEYQDMKPGVWTEVLRPTLARDRGHAMFIGTPKGFANIHDVYKIGATPNTVWKSWQFPTITSPFIPEDEIASAKNEMDEKTFRQEFEASFESMSGRVYYPFDRRTHVGQFPFNPDLPIWYGCDFNIDPMSGVVIQPQLNGELWVVDEIFIRNSSTEEVANELERRYWKYMNKVTIYPDPAGNSRQHARGESDLDIFREKGFRRIKFRPKHPAISDRVNSLNRMLMNANGQIMLRVNNSCTNTIESLEQTLYKAGSRDIDKKPGVEHITDALGYPVEIEFPIRKIQILGVSI